MRDEAGGVGHQSWVCVIIIQDDVKESPVWPHVYVRACPYVSTGETGSGRAGWGGCRGCVIVVGREGVVCRGWGFLHVLLLSLLL